MRTILHSDLNNFYASCEQVSEPWLKDLCFAVCGSVKNRHGIILAKNQNAKKLGIKTGMTINDAQKLCPDLHLKEADFDKYLDYSQKVRKIYLEYTDLVEPFGIDEAWLDVTNSKIFGSGEQIALKIRERVKSLGLTASVGVSFNKIFAKLGSDLHKPDATTIISYDNFKQMIWGLDCSELLMVGKKTAQKLAKYNIHTIGDLANVNPDFLADRFGKHGLELHLYANGKENSPVRKFEEPDEIKSVGNSMTCYRDLSSLEDVHIMLSLLSESVATRLMRKNLGLAQTLSIYVRDENLVSFTRQAKLTPPSVLAEDFLNLSLKLFKENFDFTKTVRSIGISVSDFTSAVSQLNMFDNPEDFDKKVKLAKTVGNIRDKYGNKSLQKAINLKDRRLTGVDVEKSGTIHPQGYKPQK